MDQWTYEYIGRNYLNKSDKELSYELDYSTSYIRQVRHHNRWLRKGYSHFPIQDQIVNEIKNQKGGTIYSRWQEIRNKYGLEESPHVLKAEKLC